MKKTIETIAIDKIVENDQHNRSMDDDEISLLADSIMMIGLLQPLLVMDHTGEGGKKDYMLLSGHRRLAAIKDLNKQLETAEKIPEEAAIKKPLLQVPCVALSEIDDDWSAQEVMIQANIARRDPDEINNEIVLSVREWNSMNTERQKKLKMFLIRRFSERCRALPDYKADPKKFIKERFNPEYEYIRFLTGLDQDNSVVKKTYDEALGDQPISGVKKMAKKQKNVYHGRKIKVVSPPYDDSTSESRPLSHKEVGKKLLNPLGYVEFLRMEKDPTYMNDPVFAAIVDNLINAFDEYLDYTKVYDPPVIL